jgi:dipeptidyl aminopeptidase/acylaminoacyl peptidase
MKHLNCLSKLATRSILAGAFACFAISVGATETRGVTAKDVFALKIAENPQISPDGRFVVYESHYNDQMTDTRHSNLWIASTDGRIHRALTSGAYSDRGARWSPDGKELAFTSDRDKPRQIYKIRPDDGEIVRLTDLSHPPDRINWSPDGRYLSFVALVPGAPLSVAEPLTPPAGATWAAPPRYYDQLRYRWDGMGYLDRGMLQVFVVPSDGGAARQVTDGDLPNGGTSMNDSPQQLAGPATPVWSPDGKYLYVSTTRRKDYEYYDYDTEVYRISVSDGAVTQLTDRRGPDSNPIVSPDGRRIAYLGYDDRFMGYQVVQLYLMNSDGTGARSLTAGLDRDVSDIAWSSDGRWIYFLYVDRGETRLARISRDGRMEDLATGVGARPSAYHSGGFSVAGNGTYAYTAISSQRFGSINVGRAGRSDPPRTIVDVNGALFDGRQLGRVEEFTYESVADGKTIHGWIVYPIDFDASKKYPLILEIHGGPFANYGARFDLRFQSMADRGYVVLYTNPRGSTSYGQAFGNLIHHAYPSKDFDDLESGVDAVIARGFIDEDRIFITGGSGGGILTAWAIGKTHRYRAAVILYPAVNFASWALTSDKALKLSSYVFPGFPWAHRDDYDARSPISMAGNIRTPTLIMTGEDDFRTPISESEQLYAALKLNRVEVVLARYPGEGHGIGARPSNTISTIENTLAWFERHSSR